MQSSETYFFGASINAEIESFGGRNAEHRPVIDKILPQFPNGYLKKLRIRCNGELPDCTVTRKMWTNVTFMKWRRGFPKKNGKIESMYAAAMSM